VQTGQQTDVGRSAGYLVEPFAYRNGGTVCVSSLIRYSAGWTLLWIQGRLHSVNGAEAKVGLAAVRLRSVVQPRVGSQH
jgi:hypothetical protein